MKALHALLITGLILAVYAMVWGSITTFGIGIALAAAAWLVTACVADVREAGDEHV